MSKLHELLAVDQNLKGQAAKVTSDLQNTFEKKTHLFSESLLTYTPFDVNIPSEIREQSTLNTTVRKEIKWLEETLAKSFDVSYQIDIANTQAKADIILEDGTIVSKDVPATALLQLEKRLQEIKNLVLTIPTLDPAKGFTPDSTRESGVSKAREIQAPSTKKEQKPLVLYPATEKHPAQVQMITEDIRTGTIQKLEWSGLITPAVKSEVLEKAEDLIRAVAKARSRANGQEIDVLSNKIGKKLLDLVFKPIFA